MSQSANFTPGLLIKADSMRFSHIPHTPLTQNVTSDVCAKAEPETSNMRLIKSFFILVKGILKEGIGFYGIVAQSVQEGKQSHAILEV